MKEVIFAITSTNATRCDMRIQYDPEIGLVVSIGWEERRSIVRTLGVLIAEFEDECDVSFLRWCLGEAELELKRTVN